MGGPSINNWQGMLCAFFIYSIWPPNGSNILAGLTMYDLSYTDESRVQASQSRGWEESSSAIQLYCTALQHNVRLHWTISQSYRIINVQGNIELLQFPRPMGQDPKWFYTGPPKALYDFCIVFKSISFLNIYPYFHCQPNFFKNLFWNKRKNHRPLVAGSW